MAEIRVEQRKRGSGKWWWVVLVILIILAVLAYWYFGMGGATGPNGGATSMRPVSYQLLAQR